MNEETAKCPYCLGPIVPGAQRCRHCDEILDPAQRKIQKLQQELEALKRSQNQPQTPVDAGAQSKETATCPYCLEDIPVGAQKCIHCDEILDPALKGPGVPQYPQGQPQTPTAPGVPQYPQGQPQTPVSPGAPGGNVNANADRSPKKRSTYVLLAIFLGSLGTHNFYAGYTTRGLLQLVFAVLAFGNFQIRELLYSFRGPALNYEDFQTISYVLAHCVYLRYVVWLWVLIEIFAVKKDAQGRRFS